MVISPSSPLHWTLILTKEREIMNTQDAIFNGEQHLSDSGQEAERILQEEETGRPIGAIGAGESTRTADIPHHRTCCCQFCWPKNINAYL